MNDLYIQRTYFLYPAEAETEAQINPCYLKWSSINIANSEKHDIYKVMG